MSQLSNTNIENVEEYIKNNKLGDEIPAISEYMKPDAAKYWKQIEVAPSTYYYKFAEAAYGMTSYGFYKSREGKIYIINAYINSISNIMEITREQLKEWF